MRRARRWITAGLILAVIAAGALLLIGHAQRHPEDMPWTGLDLGRPIGLFTGRKLVALREDPGLCRALLERAGIRHVALPPRDGGDGCGYADGVRFAEGGARRIDYRPADLGTSCAVAAALALWEWHVVQPAAQRHLGSRVTGIEHFGSYNCRRINNRDEGDWSEHATANAVDIAAFRLEDGRRISIVGDWTGAADEAAFLRAVRDGACDVFATVLSPDYNAAHRDHLHFDQASRGASGWRACR